MADWWSARLGQGSHASFVCLRCTYFLAGVSAGQGIDGVFGFGLGKCSKVFAM